MAYLYQEAASVTNANTLTISMWVKALTANAPSPAGDRYTLLELNGVYIYLFTNSTAANGGAIRCEFYGVADSIDGTSICTTSNEFSSATDWLTYRPGLPAPDPSSGGGNPWNSITGNMLSPSLVAYTTGNMDGMISPGKWFHLMIAVDTSYAIGYGEGHKVIISINRVPYLNLGGPTDGVHSPTYTNGVVPSTLDDASGRFAFGPFVASSSSTGDTTSGTIPAFNFDINGAEIGIPSFSGGNTQIVQMADVQVWVGKFIDPTNGANFSQFVSISGGRGYPASPDEAARTFGQQTYLFSGGTPDFYTNGGNGGSFTVVGTINTINGPSY